MLRLIFTLIKPFGAGTGMSLPIAVVRDIAESRVVRELILYYVSVAVGIGTVILIFLMAAFASRPGAHRNTRF